MRTKSRALIQAVALVFAILLPISTPDRAQGVYLPAPPAHAVYLVYFDWGSDLISEFALGSGGSLTLLLNEWKRIRPASIKITGYTDRSLSIQESMDLSKNMAENVANFLIQHAVPPIDLIVTWRGQEDNRVPTGPGVRELQNRRVEIVFGYDNPSLSTEGLLVINNDVQVGRICIGPLGPGPCTIVSRYLQSSTQQFMVPSPIQPASVIDNIPGVGPICTGPLGAGPCAAVQQYILQTYPSAGRELPNSGSLSAQQVGIECAHQSRLNVGDFASCTGHRMILPQNQQAVLDCAVSSRTVEGFGQCAAPQLGIKLTNEQRIVADCGMRSKGNASNFLDCAGSAVLNHQLTSDENEVLACARNNVDKLSEFASCSASHIIGSHLTSQEQVAVQCAAQSDGDYGNFASCTGANLFNMRLNPEQQIAVQCVVSTGGQLYAAAGCIATRLTARELTKCLTNGFGDSDGCFGDDNDLFGKNGWTARILGHPEEIWGGNNSVLRNPDQIWGGTNSFVRDPSQFWGGNNSIFNNPSQLKVDVGTIGGTRICIPWC